MSGALVTFHLVNVEVNKKGNVASASAENAFKTTDCFCLA